MDFKDLKRDGLYKVKHQPGVGSKAVFKWISQGGYAIFQPPGEPDMQSCFSLYPEEIIDFVRMATKQEREGGDPEEEDCVCR